MWAVQPSKGYDLKIGTPVASVL